MTGTTVKNALFNGNPMVNAIANTQKVTGKTQDFGAVLDKTAQKFEQPQKTDAQNTKTVRNDRATGDNGTPADEKLSGTDAQTTDAADTKVSETEKPETTASEKEVSETEDSKAAQVVDEEIVDEEPVDEMTIDEIANALEQIIGQIKEILGITDDELSASMEDLGMKATDLLNADNMAQLVTSISGADSTISLVADEELYTALQDITEMVDTQVNELLENTGLTKEELDMVLQKLQEMQGQETQDTEPEAALQEEPEMAPAEIREEPAVDETMRVPVLIKEDNTKTGEQYGKKYEKLPENQQENPTEIGTRNRTQDTERNAKDNDHRESKDFGQQNMSQNLQNNPTDAANAAEGVEKFTSESTENIMRQLADMVKIVKNENLTEMELQLHPASLGTVNVSLTTKGGLVTAEFTTQNEAVKAAIEAQASQLRANLEEQGVKIEAIEVSVESHQMERNLDKNGQEQQRQAQEQETGRIQGMRRGSINLRAFADGEELEGEMQGADDATRIAMEMMAANGNTMDLLA